MISIIIPVYNRDKTLKECLENILNQTIEKFEVILVYCDSSDESLKICEKFENDYSNVKLIESDTNNLISTFKLGLKSSRGEYICLFDANISAKKTYLEKLYTPFTKFKLDLSACCDIENNFNDESFFGIFENSILQDEKENFLESSYIKAFTLNFGNKLVKKSILENAFAYADEGLSKFCDFNINIPALLDSKSVFFVDEKLYDYCNKGEKLNLKPFNKEIITLNKILYNVIVNIFYERNLYINKNKFKLNLILSSINEILRSSDEKQFKIEFLSELHDVFSNIKYKKSEVPGEKGLKLSLFKNKKFKILLMLYGKNKNSDKN